MGFNVQKRNYKVLEVKNKDGALCLHSSIRSEHYSDENSLELNHQLKLQGENPGRKGQLAIATEVLLPECYLVCCTAVLGWCLDWNKTICDSEGFRGDAFAVHGGAAQVQRRHPRVPQVLPQHLKRAEGRDVEAGWQHRWRRRGAVPEDSVMDLQPSFFRSSAADKLVRELVELRSLWLLSV